MLFVGGGRVVTVGYIGCVWEEGGGDSGIHRLCVGGGRGVMVGCRQCNG